MTPAVCAMCTENLFIVLRKTIKSESLGFSALFPYFYKYVLGEKAVNT